MKELPLELTVILAWTDGSGEVVRFHPQSRDVGKGWFNCSVSFMFKPKGKKIMDVALWQTDKHWWEFWK